MSDPKPQDTSTDASSVTLSSLMENEWVLLGIEYGLKAGVLVLILIGGWVCAGILGKAATRLIDRLGIEVLAERLGAARLLYKIGVRGGVAKLGGKLARFAVLVLTGYAALSQLQIGALTDAMSAALGFVPTLLTAAALAAGGLWLSEKLKGMILGEGEEPGGTRTFLAQLASVATLTMAIMMALEQVGVQMELLHSLLLGVYGVVVCVGGVMFALGARQSMHQMIAGHYGRKLLKIGDHVQLGESTERYEITGFGTMHVIAERDATHEALIPYTSLLDERLRVVYNAVVEADEEDAPERD